MAENSRQVTLPSGRVATIRDGKGRDLIQAQRLVGRTAEPAALMQALAAILCEIDGKPVMYEDVLDMPIADVLMLEAQIVENFPEAAFPTPPVSPDSSTSALAPANSKR